MGWVLSDGGYLCLVLAHMAYLDFLDLAHLIFNQSASCTLENGIGLIGLPHLHALPSDPSCCVVRIRVNANYRSNIVLSRPGVPYNTIRHSGCSSSLRLIGCKSLLSGAKSPNIGLPVLQCMLTALSLICSAILARPGHIIAREQLIFSLAGESSSCHFPQLIVATLHIFLGIVCSGAWQYPLCFGIVPSC